MKEDKYKLSIRFYNDREVRAEWNEEKGVWFFSVLDVIGAINGQDDYAKTRNYWKYLKAKIKKENGELVSATNQLKLLAADGKLHVIIQARSKKITYKVTRKVMKPDIKKINRRKRR